MFDRMQEIPSENRWHNQAYPSPIVVALIARQFQKATKQLLLIRRIKRPFAGQWALVGGKWDFGETLEHAVVREVFEETGLACSLTAVRGMVSERLISPDNAQKAAHFLLFVCELAVESGEAREQNEGEVAWFTLAEIEQLNEQKTIIPSDYQMIAQFGKTAVSMPLVEADMIRYGGGEVEKFPDLVKFERFNHSLRQAKAFLGKMVTVEIDRPMGSMHPTDGFEYPVNYGYLPNVLAPDGDALDVYVLGVAEPLNRFNGRCTAIIHRLDDDDDKLVVVPDGVQMSDAEILTAVSFQEQYFQSRVVRD